MVGKPSLNRIGALLNRVLIGTGNLLFRAAWAHKAATSPANDANRTACCGRGQATGSRTGSVP
jgi:hypothetical protein